MDEQQERRGELETGSGAAEPRPDAHPGSYQDSYREPYLEIQGGRTLSGEVTLLGAKNAALPALVAACLSDEETVLYDVPTELNDVRLLAELLRSLGAEVSEAGPHTLRCRGRGWRAATLDGNKAGSLRHSLLLLGGAAHRHLPLTLPLPGGCKLGERKHDFHVAALSALGFAVTDNPEGLGVAAGGTARGTAQGATRADARVSFGYPSFGATLNALFAATGLPAVTLIENAARNPEVEDVTMMLNKMGAQISWADARTLRVVGGTPLRGTEHRVMGDRIVASTLIAVTAVTRGETFIRNASLRVLRAEAEVWLGAGLELTDDEGGIRVRAGGRLGATTVTTRAYPGFHTDVQPLHAAMMVLADGRSEIRETILDGRFRYAAELAKFGAAVAVLPGGFRCVNGEPGQVLQLDGVAALHGAEVQATDIRGGAAVVVAALAAEGVSRVTNLYQLERGYSDLAGLLTPLGAAVRRLEGTATPHAARP